jgi:hypothetical protein
MKSISQLVRLVSQSDSCSDTGSENPNPNSNMSEATLMQAGTSGALQSNALLNPLQQRQKLVAQTAVTQIFTKDWFDICKLDAVMDALSKGSKSHPSYKLLRALHCVHYRDMPKDLIDQLPQFVNEILTDKRDINFASAKALDGVFD